MGKWTAWLVHAYTASSALFGFLALGSIVQNQYRQAFLWLALTVAIDATDGTLARRLDVASRLPRFDGARLDDIVDYVTYVLVPAFFVWHAGLVSERWSLAVAASMLLSSAYGFARAEAKTADHFFTGFPSYWNIVVFYLHLAGWPVMVNAVVLGGLSALVFAPVRFVYPTRTPVLRRLTMALGVGWGLLVAAILWQMPAVSMPLFWISLGFPAYYGLLSLALELRRRGGGISLRS